MWVHGFIVVVVVGWGHTVSDQTVSLHTNWWFPKETTHYLVCHKILWNILKITLNYIYYVTFITFITFFCFFLFYTFNSCGVFCATKTNNIICFSSLVSPAGVLSNCTNSLGTTDRLINVSCCYASTFHLSLLSAQMCTPTTTTHF